MRVYDLLVDLATCLCQQINEAGLPEPCFCGVVPGSEVALEYAGNCQTKCGMAWVRMVNSYPSTIVGVPDIVEGNCGKARGVDIELGIARCMPVGKTTGAPPTPEQLLTAADMQEADMAVLFRAVNCCDALPTKDVIVGTYEPFGPEGGLVGGTLIVQTQVF